MGGSSWEAQRKASAALDEQRTVEDALARLTESLHERRPERGPARERREGIDIVLDHLERHGPTLSGHAIVLPERAGGGVRLVPRSNIVLERFFRDCKHDERRRSGRKCLTQDLEQLPAAAMLARNLLHADYLEILCGSLHQLPTAFAELDTDHRNLALPALRERSLRVTAKRDTASSDPDSKQSADSAPSHDRPDDPVPDIASASMPRADRSVFRAKALDGLLQAASRCRVPRFHEPQATAV